MKTIKKAFAFAVALSMAVLAGVSSASAIGLDQILGSGTGCIGDKCFSNFSYTQGVGAPTASTVDVQLVGTQPGGPDYYGLNFNLTGWSVGPGQSFAALIEYDVTVTDPNWLIHDIHLDFDYGVVGDAFAKVTETVLDGNLVVAQAFVESFTPTTMVWLDLPYNLTTPPRIKKDILLAADPCPTTNTNCGNSASIDRIGQRFSQVSVPEPVSLLLMGSGLLGMAVVRRKKAE